MRAAIADAGLPEGTFAHLLAAGIEVGEALVDAPAIQAVGFTGSTAGGRAIMDRAARRPQPIPVYAEMGSINPIVVTEAALRRARPARSPRASSPRVANFGGQLCTKPGVVFVPDGEAGNAFVRSRRGAARRRSRPPCCSTSACATRSPPASSGSPRCADVRAARRRRRRARADGYRHQPAAFQAPAAAVAAGAPLLEEHFGPVVVLLRYGGPRRAARRARPIEGQLTGTVHAEPDEDAELLGAALRDARRARGAA